MWVKYVARTDTKINVCKAQVGKPERTRPIGRSMYKWENNIEINFGYMRCVCGVLNVAQNTDP